MYMSYLYIREQGLQICRLVVLVGQVCSQRNTTIHQEKCIIEMAIISTLPKVLGLFVQRAVLK